MIVVDIASDGQGWYWTSEDGIYPLWEDAERYPTRRVCEWAVTEHFVGESFVMADGTEPESRPETARRRSGPLGKPGPKRRNTCMQGHVYSGTYSNGRPICRVCASARAKRHKARKRALRAPLAT